MTSWWGTRDTGFYTRNNRKSSHCTGALPLIDSQLNVWLVTNNRLAVARAAHCEVGELVTDAMANWFVIECVWSLSSPFTLFSSLSLRQLSRDQTPLLSPSLLQGSATVFIMPQSPPARWSNESWLKSETLACRLCRVYFFRRHRYLIAPLPVPFWSLRVCVCQCGSWSGILNAVYSCCGWLVKARYGRQLVIRLIMLPLCEVGVMWLLSAVHIVLLGGNLSRLNVLNVVRDVLLNA